MSTSYPQSEVVSDINLLSHFLSDLSTDPSTPSYKTDTIVVCASSVLHGAETIFHRLADASLVAKTLVLCGGVGHSTQLIWDAVARHPEYSVLTDEVQGKPEARVLEMILNRFFDISGITARGCRVLIEDRSTNCGANAAETRRVLEAADGLLLVPKEIMIVQDPTMSLRTRASFEKVYEDVSDPPKLISFPVFVPMVEISRELRCTQPNVAQDTRSLVTFQTPEVPSEQLWNMTRFVELIVGEIPRLRDDESGYGPRGRNFIAHVDVPQQVDQAWQRVRDRFGASR